MSVDFQRLADVRARRLARRRRWVVGAATIFLAVLIVGAGHRLAPILPVRVPVDAEARGRVETVEPSAGIIRVASGFLGLMSVELAVTSDTLIVVGDKEGGFGDLRTGAEVRAAYERRPGLLQAKRVEVMLHPAPAAPR